MMEMQTKVYDFVFIGLGASNSLILISLIKNGLTKNKQIAVFESAPKNTNDKTYCFWATPDDPIVAELGSIISHSFDNIRVKASRVESIKNCPYHYIRSIDLYNAAFDRLHEAHIDIYRSPVEDVITEDQINTLQTSDGNFQAKYIFDSRPPIMDASNTEDIYLLQSFYGLHITCENNVFEENTFEMMNFKVEQDKFTQFLYVIPFSTNEALVELTRFGAEKIDLTYASALLEEFISQEFGQFEKLADEVGCIPMTTFRNPVNESSGILHTGASANLIKPSTGYGFKNMFYFAQQVTKRVSSDNLDDFNKIAIHSKARSRFYDKLLLIILFHWPSFGKKIFTTLFQKVPILTIFSFLEEKTSLREEIKIFSALPVKPFLKALYFHLKMKNLLRYVFASFLVIAYLTLFYAHQQSAQNFNYLFLIAGLLWIGIPHGALDHLLSKNDNTSLPIFIGKYLLIMGLYLVVWQFFPLFSLLAFVAYSSFHFGESEFIQNREQIKTFGSYVKASLLGLSILLFIISTHLEESLAIISSFSMNASIPLSSINLESWSLFLSIASLSYLLFNYFLSRSISYLGMLVLLILGTQVPVSMAFGLYFIVQHSYNAWNHLKQGLNLSSRQLHLKSSLFTFGALLIFLSIAYLVKDTKDLTSLWANFFIFIACISLPHFVMMHLFYRSRI